jgi:hypothetical protein
MPTLKLGTLCEKVVIDAHGVPSLISLFSQFNVNIPAGTTFAENALAAKEWAMFSLWECSPEEADREFTQVFEITTPAGELFSPPQIIKFRPQHGSLRQNVIANATAVPIGHAGRVTVTSRLELDGQPITESMIYGFDVAYVETA